MNVFAFVIRVCYNIFRKRGKIMKKHTRNSFSYKVRRAIWNFDIKKIFNLVLEIITAIVFFGALLFLPHLFH